MLFATLDPTLRAIDLPHGTKAILSDTVGFISELPTMLVAAFRATLEEVIEADVILHVRDVSHEDTQAQLHDVENVLRSLGIEPEDPRIIEVWNKIDRLDDAGRTRMQNLSVRASSEHPADPGVGADRRGDRCAAGRDRRPAGGEPLHSRIWCSIRPMAPAPAGFTAIPRCWRDRSRSDDRIAMTVRADAAHADMVRRKFEVASG